MAAGRKPGLGSMKGLVAAKRKVDRREIDDPPRSARYLEPEWAVVPRHCAADGATVGIENHAAYAGGA